MHILEYEVDKDAKDSTEMTILDVDLVGGQQGRGIVSPEGEGGVSSNAGKAGIGKGWSLLGDDVGRNGSSIFPRILPVRVLI